MHTKFTTPKIHRKTLSHGMFITDNDVKQRGFDQQKSKI
jgi:hypothetical protein